MHNVVPAWLELNGKAKDSIRLLRMDPAVVDASLIEGKIDLAECWRGSNRAVMQKQAAAAGVSVGWVEYSDFGLDAYGSGIATTEDIIAKRPDLVKKFLQATYKGYEFAIANPEKATDLMIKAYPTVDRAVALQQIKEINTLITDAKVKDKGLGYLRDDRMPRRYRSSTRHSTSRARSSRRTSTPTRCCSRVESGTAADRRQAIRYHAFKGSAPGF